MLIDRKDTSMKFLSYKQNQSWQGVFTLPLSLCLLPLIVSCQGQEVAESPIGNPEAAQAPNTTESIADRTVTAPPFLVAQQVERNVELEDITENLQDLLGRTVSVRSDVTNIAGANAFRLEDDDWFEGESVLVINATGKAFVPPEDIELQVTGKVQQFVLADIEREYGLDLNPDVFVEYERQPVIIAQSLALAPEPAEVTENPSRFYNQVIAVKGEIEEFKSPGIFRLEKDQLFGGEGLLALSKAAEVNGTASGKALEEDDTVVVTGVLRPFVQAELERDYGWGTGVLGEVEAEYNKKPVLVAREIYTNVED